MFIQYGVQITTRQTATDYEIGCASGVLKWGTGRSDLGTFKNGIVLKDSFSEISVLVEISRGGSYGTMSSFSLKIDNAKNYADIIRNLGLELVQSDAIFYSFRRDLETDPWVSTQDWSGKISDWSYDENQIEISFMDSFRGVQKSILTEFFTVDKFPDLPTNLIGQPIPVSIGLVSKNKLFPIVQKQDFEIICTNLGLDYNIAPCTAYSVTGAGAFAIYKITLYTIDKIITADALAGKYLTVIKGGSDSILIISNLASSGGYTVLTISGPLSATPIFWSTPGIDVWYFQVSSLVIKYLAAQYPIYEFENPLLSVFDSVINKFDDISELGNIFDTTDIELLGYPGCTVLSKPDNINGDAFYKIFEALSFVSKFSEIGTGLAGAITGSGHAISPGSDLPNLRDFSNDTGYTWIGSSSGGASSIAIPFLFILNKNWITSNFTNIFFAFKVNLSFTDSNGFSVLLNVKLLDFIGRFTAALDATDRLIYLGDGDDPYILTKINESSLIASAHGVPYGDVQSFENIKQNLSLNYNGAENISKASDVDIYYRALFELKFKWFYGISTSTITIDMREVTLVGEKKFNLLQSNIYTALKGRTFETTWVSRKTAANPIQNVAEAIESLLRQFEGGSTNIDTASFDIVGDETTGLLKDFYVGQQFTKDANSADLIDELCRFSFTALVPKNNGTKALKSWMDSTSIATHTDTNNTILKDSIGIKEYSLLADVFNSPQINYNWNPEANKFDSVLSIVKIDADSFPLEATLDSFGVPLWKSYAVGYNDDEYDEAKTNWDYCHLSWSKYGMIRTLESSMADVNWFPNVETDWGLTATYSAAKAYMRRLCKWVPFRKEIVSYNLPNTATHAPLELLDQITFADSTDREGAEFDGWIVEKTIVPGEGKDFISIKLMLEPDAWA